MLGKIIKIAVFIGILYLGYKAMYVYAFFQFGSHMNECTSTQQLCQLVKRQAPSNEISAVMQETFACVKSKQSRLEAILLPMDRNMSEPHSENVNFSEAAEFCPK